MRNEHFNLIALVIFTVVVFQLFGCSDNRFANKDFSNKPVNLHNPHDRQKFDEISRELEKKRSLWREKNISNYDFACERYGEGMGGDFIVTFEVRNNEPFGGKDIKLPRLKDADINDLPYFNKEINSIDKLFDYTQRALEDGDRVDVTFNTRYGFPEDVKIRDFGSWVTIEVTAFEIVE